MKNNSSDKRRKLLLLVVRWKVAEIGFPTSLAVFDVILNYIGSNVANRAIKFSRAQKCPLRKYLFNPGKFLNKAPAVFAFKTAKTYDGGVVGGKSINKCT